MRSTSERHTRQRLWAVASAALLSVVLALSSGLPSGSELAASSLVSPPAAQAAQPGAVPGQGSGAGSQDDQPSSCITCHAVFEETPIGDMVEPYDRGVHAAAGLGCQACHGGDPSARDKEVSMSPERGYTGVPSRGDIPALCGSCHSSAEYMRRFNPSLRIDQVAEYRTSVHGMKLLEGDPNVATCTSCHGVHGILSSSNPLASVHPAQVADTCATCHSDAGLMDPYGVPADQAELFKTSVHGNAIYQRNDFGAATCNDCHGNHGATPPGVESVANVCGNCHGIQEELFSESSHKAVFEMFDMATCITCHGNHEIAPPGEALLTVGQAACLQCHEDGDAGMQAARSMAEDISSLSAQVEEARRLLERAEQAGMEVSSAQFDLHGANEKVILARNLVHTILPDRVEETVSEGMQVALAAEQAGHEAFEELGFRRRGLFVALALIALVIVTLWLVIRQADRKLEESRQSA